MVMKEKLEEAGWLAGPGLFSSRSPGAKKEGREGDGRAGGGRPTYQEELELEFPPSPAF